MAQSFGRRQATPSTPVHPVVQAAATPILVHEADPRLRALAESARASRDPSWADLELRDYAARRHVAIGPWRRLAYALTLAPPAAAYLLGVHGLWLAPISLASLCAPGLLKRARLRWAEELGWRGDVTLAVTSTSGAS